MDYLTNLVVKLCFGIKMKTLAPMFRFLESSSGHEFTRRIGPIINALFYFTQIIHAYCFYFDIGPAFIEQYTPKVGNFAVYLYILLGWFLCYKVTYTYYWVSTTNPGTTDTLNSLKPST